MRTVEDDRTRRRRGVAWLLAFLAAQTLLTVVFKASVMFAGWYWPGMLVSCAMTMLTTWLLMRVFAFFQPHLAQALGIGISFVLGQAALAVLTQTWLSVWQLIGITAIFAGIFLLSEPTHAAEEGSRC